MRLKAFRSTYRPLLEPLENRLTPAVTATQLDLDGDGNADDVLLVGDANSSTVTIDSTAGDTYQVTVDLKSNGNVSNLGSFTFSDGSVVFDLRLAGGNDQVTLSGGDLSGQSMLVEANLGGGNDAFTAEYFGTTVDAQSHLTFDLIGGGGADTIDFLIQGDFVQSALTVRGNLGGGGDQVEFSASAAFNNGDSLEMDWDLGPGNNVLDMSFLDVGAIGFAILDIDVTGGNSATAHDEVTVEFLGTVGNGTLPTSVTVDADLLAGNDIFDVLLEGGGLNLGAESHLLVSARGGTGNDTLAVRFDGFGTTDSVAIPAQALVKVELFGGAGKDTLQVESTSVNLISLELDGILRVRLDGGVGNDNLAISLDNNGDSTGDYDIAAFGGTGNDLFDFFLFPGGSVGFDPLGKVFLDGGAGIDSLVTNTGSLATAIRFEPAGP